MRDFEEQFEISISRHNRDLQNNPNPWDFPQSPWGAFCMEYLPLNIEMDDPDFSLDWDSNFSRELQYDQFLDEKKSPCSAFIHYF
jgi:hypothetical protein